MRKTLPIGERVRRPARGGVFLNWADNERGPRLFVDPEAMRPVGERIALAEREARHAIATLRLGEGAIVTLLDGEGTIATGRLVDVRKKSASVDILDERRASRPAPEIWLAVAVLKTKAMDLVLQKAVELGAGRLIPVRAERVVARWGPEDNERRRERIRLACVDALKQCGGAWLPEIEPPSLLSPSALDRGADVAHIVATLANDAAPLRRALAERDGRPTRAWCVWIGPEGDFTSDELETLKTGGARPITLGERVLRAETAALYALAAMSDRLWNG